MTLIGRAAGWLYAGQLATVLLNFIGGVVLARLLGPQVFGLFIAVTAFTSLAFVAAQFGLPQALVQSKTLADTAVNAAFWFSALIACIVFAALVAVAPWLARFFEDPQFVPVMWAMSGILLLSPYNAIGLALLRRDMRFDVVVRVDVLALMVSLVFAISVALAGAGVFSLVVGAFAAMLVVTVALARNLTWRPSLPQLRPVFRMLGYAWFAMLNALLGSAASRVDNMLIGGLLGTVALGLYNRAYSLARIPTDQFAESLSPLLLRSLARVQDDPEAARVLLAKAGSSIALVTLPLLALLLVAGPLAIEFLYGTAWAGAGAPLRVMVIGALFLVLSVPLRGYINALGLVKELLWINLAATLATVFAVLALWPWGLVGIAVGISLREAGLFFLMASLLRRSHVALPPGELGYAVVPALIAAMFATIVGYLVLSSMEPTQGLLWSLVLITSAMLAVYATLVLLAMLLWPGHPSLATARNLLSTVGRRGSSSLRTRFR